MSDAQELYARWTAGELEATGLEAKARIILGWDHGETSPLSEEERAFMVKDAYACDCNHPSDEAPEDDTELCRWWLGAMNDYVQDMF